MQHSFKLKGASLGTMVGFLTYGNKKFYELDDQIRKLLPTLYTSMKDIVPYIDADTAAFNQYMVSHIMFYTS